MNREFLNDNKQLIREYLCDLCTCDVDVIEFFLYPEDGRWRVMYMNIELDYFNYDRIKLNENDVIKYIRKRKIERVKDNDNK